MGVRVHGTAVSVTYMSNPVSQSCIEGAVEALGLLASPGSALNH